MSQSLLPDLLVFHICCWSNCWSGAQFGSGQDYTSDICVTATAASYTAAPQHTGDAYRDLSFAPKISTQALSHWASPPTLKLKSKWLIALKVAFIICNGSNFLGTFRVSLMRVTKTKLPPPIIIAVLSFRFCRSKIATKTWSWSVVSASFYSACRVGFCCPSKHQQGGAIFLVILQLRMASLLPSCPYGHFELFNSSSSGQPGAINQVHPNFWKQKEGLSCSALSSTLASSPWHLDHLPLVTRKFFEKTSMYEWYSIERIPKFRG